MPTPAWCILNDVIERTETQPSFGWQAEYKRRFFYVLRKEAVAFTTVFSKIVYVLYNGPLEIIRCFFRVYSVATNTTGLIPRWTSTYPSELDLPFNDLSGSADYTAHPNRVSIFLYGVSVANFFF